MRALIVAVFILMIPSAVLSAEKFSVNQEEAGADEYGRVTLIYTVANGHAFDIATLDIVLHQSLEIDKIEAGTGWTVSIKTPTTAQLSPRGGLRPGGNSQIKLVVKMHGNGPSIFQVRRPDPVMTVTTLFADGEKMVRTINPPFIPKMRK